MVDKGSKGRGCHQRVHYQPPQELVSVFLCVCLIIFVLLNGFDLVKVRLDLVGQSRFILILLIGTF